MRQKHKENNNCLLGQQAHYGPCRIHILHQPTEELECLLNVLNTTNEPFDGGR